MEKYNELVYKAAYKRLNKHKQQIDKNIKYLIKNNGNKNAIELLLADLNKVKSDIMKLNSEYKLNNSETKVKTKNIIRGGVHQ